MGNYKSVNTGVDNTKLPRMYPQPQYVIKTRPPVQKGYPWQENMKARILQEQLSDEAMPLARRKCYDPAMQFADCRTRQGFFWYVFNCQQVFHELGLCLDHEYKVQMDKRRRDMTKIKQSWWRSHYNEDGEVGIQAQAIDEQVSLLQSLKISIFGDNTQKN